MVWKESLVLLLCAALSLFAAACGNSSTGGRKGSGPDGASAYIQMSETDLELLDPDSSYDGNAAPGEVIAFRLTIRNTGDTDGRIDIQDLNIAPSGSLQGLTYEIGGSPVADLDDIHVPASGSTLLVGTGIVSPTMATPSVLVMGPPEIAPSTPPTDPPTVVEPEEIKGFDTLTITSGSGSGESEGRYHARRPGSVMIFPFFRISSPGGKTVKDTLITITNTNSDLTPGPTGLPAGTIDVKFYYLEPDECLPFDRWERLTPNDTLSVMASYHFPNDGESQGWLYVVAMDPVTGEPVDFDYLIGHATYFDVNRLSWFQYNPVSFRALPGDGLPTDLDFDGHQDLNGQEYEQMGDEQLYARFIGQFTLPPNNGHQAELLLLNLTGGAKFYSSIDFLVYNDNEQVFSTSFDFKCWILIPLEDISGLFSNDFLKGTNHDPDEGLNLLGNPGVETGWFRMDGNVAWYYTKSIDDPALMSLMVEWYNNRFTITTPFDNGEKQNNATLWPVSPLGDNED